MRAKRKILFRAAASVGLLGFVGYPAVKFAYPVTRKKPDSIVDDYVDLPTATADLTKADVVLPEGIGTGTDIPVDISHWLLLSMLRSSNSTRRQRALDELAWQRRWNDAECVEIAQALDRQDIVKLARTLNADIRLFLRPPTVEFIEATLKSNKIEKFVKSMLKDVAERWDSCSSCTNFYTNLSIRVRPDPNILAMNDLNQVERGMRIESRKKKKSAYNEDIIKLKAILNNIICGERQALSMAQSGILVALLYFRLKYKDDLQINSLLSQILANFSLNSSTKQFVFTDGWIQTLVEYTQSEHLELSLPAVKALANLDDEVNASFGNHLYLLSPSHRNEQVEPQFDVIFVHGLVGSVFKSWRQGTIAIDEFGNKCSPKNFTPTTELLPTGPAETFSDEISSVLDSNKVGNSAPGEEFFAPFTKCWPRDWLAKDVPGLRVLAVDYPTALSSWRTDCDLNKDSLKQRAIHVMRQLEAANLGERPIIWVAHSMGGLLVKQMLVLCDERLQSDRAAKLQPQNPSTSSKANNDNLFVSSATKKPIISRKFCENVTKKTKGIVFYSVPHKGSNLDWIERKDLQKLLALTTEVIELQKDSPLLLDLHKKFLNLIKKPDMDIKFMTFAETAISSFGVNKVVQWKGVLVHADSLRFDVGPNQELNIDHAHTCKPHNKTAITYVNTLEFIKDLMLAGRQRDDEDWLPIISFSL